MILKKFIPIIMCYRLKATSFINKIKEVNPLLIDEIFATIGIVVGVSIISMNFIYSNNYLITLGPLIIIACILYLKNRNIILEDTGFSLNFKKRTYTIIQIIYWVCIFIALINYNQTSAYIRKPLFFIMISISLAFLGLEIFQREKKTYKELTKIISKIFIASFIIRFSAFFISPYPIGSDPWAHAEIIREICEGTKYLAQANEYYSHYPLMHLFASSVLLLGQLNVKESMFVVGSLLVFNTIFVYLIAKGITNNTNIALLSMLLINCSDFYIQWSIQVIAMSFGIVIYTIIIYILMLQKKENGEKYKLLLIFFMILIVWTHTISSYILTISLIALYIGKHIYKYLYKIDNRSKINVALIILFMIIMINHWMNPDYPFFEKITVGLIDSLQSEAEFLGRAPIPNNESFLDSILNISGYLILTFFGVIGIIFSLSRKNTSLNKVSFICVLFVLNVIYFIFPLLGIRNIVPYRWPAFIYVSYVVFSGIGIIKTSTILRDKKYQLCYLFVILFSISFLMITNNITNLDTPIYGEKSNQRLIWTPSEMELMNKIDNLYNGTIVTDIQTAERPFTVYLKRSNISIYELTDEGDINWELFDGKVIIWRNISLLRPIQVGEGDRGPLFLLGERFKSELEANYSSIYDTGDAKAYI